MRAGLLEVAVTLSTSLSFAPLPMPLEPRRESIEADPLAFRERPLRQSAPLVRRDDRLTMSPHGNPPPTRITLLPGLHHLRRDRFHRRHCSGGDFIRLGGHPADAYP